MKQLVNTIADEKGMAVEVLMRKRDYEAILRSDRANYQLPDTMSQWRQELVGRPLIEWLEQRSS